MIAKIASIIARIIAYLMNMFIDNIVFPTLLFDIAINIGDQQQHW